MAKDRDDEKHALAQKDNPIGEVGRELILTRSIDQMTDEDVIRAYAIVTRAANALGRRQRELRKRVDAMLAARPIEGEEARLAAGPFAIVREHKERKREVDPEKAKSLFKAKKIPIARLYDEPPPPAPVFSQAKFEAFLTVEAISQEEYDGCLTPEGKEAGSVTVEVVPEIDRAISAALLGAKEPARELAAPKKKKRADG